MTEVFVSNSQQPSVTILMASYGRLELLKGSVESALNQQYENYDVLIVDDGSDDEIIKWLQQLELKQPKVSVVFQKHRGVAAARANGVEKAKAEFICILDSDDTLAPNALEMLVAAMCSTPGCQLVYCNIREIRTNGDEVIQQYHQFDSTRKMLMTTLLKPRLPFKHTGTLFRRQTALELGSYNVDLPCKVDIDLYLKFLKAGYLPVHVNEPLVDFRMHKNSVSINRLLGIKVWLYLIDCYGPINPAYRLLIKMVRVSAELLKRLYMAVRG